MSSIGGRLRAERERLELSQSQLAELAGTTRKTQFNYETDARRPDADYLAAIAAAGADVNYILTGKRGGPSPVVLTAEEQTLLDYFRDASKEARRGALGALLGAAGAVGAGSFNQTNLGHGAVQIGKVGARAGVKVTKAK